MSDHEEQARVLADERHLALKAWSGGVYDCTAGEWRTPEKSSCWHGEDASPLPFLSSSLSVPEGCPEWKCYMLEAVGGSVRGPHGALLTTEGAKVCVPLLVVVPGGRLRSQAPLALMTHFGSYEPYWVHGDEEGREEESKGSGGDGDGFESRRMSHITYLLSITNAYLQLVAPMLRRAASVARARGVRATLFVTLGTPPQGAADSRVVVSHVDFLERFLMEELETEPFKTWIHPVFHPSYRGSFPPSQGGNGFLHAHVSQRGEVRMLVATARYTTKAGRAVYDRLCRNAHPGSPDGTCMPGCTPGILHLAPAFQHFVGVDMDEHTPKAADAVRREFMAYQASQLLPPSPPLASARPTKRPRSDEAGVRV